MAQPTPQPGPRTTAPIRDNRAALARSAARILVTGVLLLALYSVLPAASRIGVWLVIGLLAFVGLVGRQIQMILRSEHPRLRAIEALGLVVPVLVLVFSFAYLSLSDASPSNFSEPLTKVDAVYFTTTVLSTVGFGDITAVSQVARALVTIQITIGLLTAVGLARLLLGAADLTISSRKASLPGDDG